MEDETWLFDCGEGTQHRIRASSTIQLSNVRKIFITHLHSDHTMGLVNLLFSISAIQIATNTSYPVELYGPVGLKEFVNKIVELTSSAVRLHKNFKFFEMSSTSDTAQFYFNRTTKTKHMMM